MKKRKNTSHATAAHAQPSPRLRRLCLAQRFGVFPCFVCRASFSHCTPSKTARSPRPLHVRRPCLHIFFVILTLFFFWSFADAALFWRFVVRSGDCVRMVAARHGRLYYPPVAPGGGFTLSHFRTAAHAATPPPTPPKGGGLKAFFRLCFPLIFARFFYPRVSPLPLRFFSVLLVLS